MNLAEIQVLRVLQTLSALELPAHFRVQPWLASAQEQGHLPPPCLQSQRRGLSSTPAVTWKVPSLRVLMKREHWFLHINFTSPGVELAPLASAGRDPNQASPMSLLLASRLSFPTMILRAVSGHICLRKVFCIKGP